MIKGIPASTGIAIGKTFVLPTWDWDLPDENIDVSDLAAEFERLYAGINTSKNELRTIKQELSGSISSNESFIFDAQLAILDDPAFMEEIRGLIQRQYKAAEVAVKEAIDKFANMFDLLEDEYMKERAVDIKDVGNRLIKHLLGAPEITLPEDNQPFILVADELSPSQLANLNPSHVEGILTMSGGRTSHSAIMARALGIPMIVNLESTLEEPLETGNMVVMDGTDGTLYLNAHMSVIREYSKRKQAWQTKQRALQQIIADPAITSTGDHFHLNVNVNSLMEMEQIPDQGIGGIGLFRTEFIYMDRMSMPTEDEQYEIYKQVAAEMKGKPVVIRTLDTGGDKKLDYFEYPPEDNPFLGYRAIRISLDHPEHLKTQMKAIMRAGVHGNVKMMYPMISSVDEVHKANSLLQQAKNELEEQNVDYRADIETGIMIEIPSAALQADSLAQEVDFFSIGTNDLVQYMIAVDRMNEYIAHLYDPFHPAVLMVLKMTVEAAKRHQIGISVCGEMAGDVRAIPLWLGLGVRHLSMSLPSLLQVKHHILNLDEEKAQRQYEQMIDCRTVREMHAIISQSNMKC